MEYTTLGRTGVPVSVMGLGGGGHSRLGQSYSRSEAESVAIVRAALSMGVRFFDTAESYGTEVIVGKGLAGVPREQVVISTKFSPVRDGQVVSRAHVQEALEASLRRLGMEYVDIYHLHGLSIQQYERAVGELAPELEKLRQQGKLRFIGVTEAFASDPGHVMLSRAVQDDCWEVMMVGFNFLNQSARERVLRVAQEKGIGILNMFAVRRALSDPATLQAVITDLGKRGKINEQKTKETLHALLRGDGASSLQDAAYRFCRYEPGIHVVLSGTGNLEHLQHNVSSLTKPPLPPEDVARLREVFASVDDVSGN